MSSRRIAAAEGADGRARRQRRRSRGPPAGAGCGRRARGAAFPMVAAGLTKADIRDLSRAHRLRTWDKPAAACLASRVPYGTEVSVGILVAGRPGRGGAEAARVPAGARAPLRRHRPARGRLDASWRAVLDRARSGRRRGEGRRLPLRHARPRRLPIRKSQRGSRSVALMKLSMMINYAGGFQQAVDQVVAAGEGGPRPGDDRRGLQLRRGQPGRLPRRQDRARRDRHRHPQRLQPHRCADGDDGGGLRLHQRRPVHPRPRRQRPAGGRGLPRCAVRRSRWCASASTSRPAG